MIKLLRMQELFIRRKYVGKENSEWQDKIL